MGNVIEILLQGRNQTGPAFNAAGAQVRTLGRELANLNPAVGGAIGQVEGLAGAFGGMVGPALIAGAALAGIAAAGVGAAINLSDTVEQLDRMAARTGVGIEPLQVLRQTLEEGGGNAESLTMALSFLNRAIATNDPILKQLGITTKDTFTAFMQLATALANSTDAGKRTEIAYQLLGRGSADLLGNLKSLVDEYGRMDSAMRANGAMISGTAAPALRELDARADSLKENWKGLMNNLAVLATPTANVVVGSLNAMIGGTIEFAKAVREQAVGALEDLAEADEKVRPVEMLALPGGGQQAGAIERASYAAGVSATRVDPLAGVNLALKKTKAEAKAVSESIAEVIRQAMQLNDAEAAHPALGVRSTTGTLRPGEPVAQGQPRATPRGLMLAEVADAKRAMDDILSVASMTRDSLAAIFEGLQSGFQTAFQGIIQGTMNLRNALISIFQSLVSSITAELARLEAASVFKFLLSLLAPGIAITPDTGAWAGLVPVPVPVMAPVGAALSNVSGGPVTNVYNTIQTITPRDAMQQYISPSGVLRIAQNRVALAGAY